MLQDILDKIVAFKKQEVIVKKKTVPLADLKINLDKVPVPRDFRNSILSHRPVSIIAEIKRCSPSAGAIRKNLNLLELARTYEQHGAAAISVLIDRKFFGGSVEDLRAVKEAVSLSVLAKEFIVDEYQIYEARFYGADAILLIARLLAKQDILKFYQIASEMQMSCIVEIHSIEEIEKISHLPASLLVGINNRDLNNFTVDTRTTERILNVIPSSWVAISESGIKNAQDVRLLQNKGVNIFLVGEAILRSKNPATKLSELRRG